MPPSNSSQTVNLFEVVRVGGLVTGLLILIGTWFAVRVIAISAARFGDRFVDRRLWINQIATLLRFGAYLVGMGLAIAVSVQLSRDVVLALAGTAAVTVGFALKDLAASVLAGLVILVDRPFQVGDRVSFGSYYGEIRSIGLRSVRLVMLDDNVVTIPNNKFLTDSVASPNWGALDMMIQMDFFVGIDQDVRLAKRLVEECVTSSRYVYLMKPWIVLVNQVVQDNHFALRLRSKAYVLDVKFEKQFETDVTERVWAAFRDHGIEAPAILHRTAGVSAVRRDDGIATAPSRPS